MILKGETVNRLRSVPFPLMDENNPLLGIAGHVFVLGEVQVSVPGAGFVNVALDHITEKGNGSYLVILTDAQCALDGDVLVFVNVVGAQAITVEEYIIDPARLGTTVAAAGSGTLLPAGLVTLASVRNIVRLRGDYLSSLTFDNPYLNLEIQAAWVELFELIDDTNENWWDTQANVTTVAAQAYLALPATCKRVQGIDILCGTEWKELRQVNKGQRNRYGSTTGLPTGYRLSSRGIEMQPTPDAAYTLRVTYSPICPALSETVGIELYGLEEYIVTGALLRLDDREERPTGARERELERQKQRVIRSANKRKQQEPEYLLLRENDDSRFEEEWD